MRRLLWTVLLAGCAHTAPQEMTASEHRAEADRHQREAEEQREASKDTPVFYGNAPRSPFSDESPTLKPYNPTAARLDEADRQMQKAWEHLKAAQALEAFEAKACEGISVAERTACPLLAPHTAWVEEIAQGLTLHLKPQAPKQRLVTQLQCHLAYAQANGFDRAPCPLYVKGVAITLVGDAIDFRSPDARVAGEVRREGRKLFGEPAGGP